MKESNHNAETIREQVESIKENIVKLLGTLPQSLDESAKENKALTRCRGLKSASDLLLMLLVYASMNISQRVLAACATLMGVAHITDQAWQKKILKCDKWLTYLLKETMPKLPPKSKQPFNGRAVKVIDGSLIQQNGKKCGNGRGGETQRIHLCYNLTEGCMDEVFVTDTKTAESVTAFKIEENAIYLAEAGFGSGKQLYHIVVNKADALFRATPNHLCLTEDEKGKAKIDMVKKLDTQKNLLDFRCFVHTEKRKYVPVRVIASRLPEDKALLAKERKMRSAKKRQCQVRDVTLIYAGWVILITSLGDEYDALFLLEMYRARWQIELLFKRIKQTLDITKLPAASLRHCRVMVLLWLILWSLTERQSIQTEMFLIDQEFEMVRYSPWVVSTILYQRLKVIINSLWALFLVPDSPSLEVLIRLQNHRASRCNQYATFHF